VTWSTVGASLIRPRLAASATRSTFVMGTPRGNLTLVSDRSPDGRGGDRESPGRVRPAAGGAFGPDRAVSRRGRTTPGGRLPRSAGRGSLACSAPDASGGGRRRPIREGRSPC